MYISRNSLLYGAVMVGVLAIGGTVRAELDPKEVSVRDLMSQLKPSQPGEVSSSEVMNLRKAVRRALSTTDALCTSIEKINKSDTEGYGLLKKSIGSIKDMASIVVYKRFLLDTESAGKIQRLTTKLDRTWTACNMLLQDLEIFPSTHEFTQLRTSADHAIGDVIIAGNKLIEEQDLQNIRNTWRGWLASFVANVPL